MDKKSIYLLVLSLIQLTVGVLAGYTLMIEAKNANYFQLTMYIAAAIFGFFLGGRGIIKFFREKMSR